MKHLIFQSRFLILLLGFLTIGISHVWGADYEELFTITSGDVVNNSGYAKYENNEKGWIITFGGNNKSVGTNSGNRSKCNLSSYSKYAVSQVTTSDVASAFVSTTSISDVSKISYTFNGGSNQTNTNVYLIYSSDGNTFSQVSLTSGTQGAAISSGTAYEFAKCSGYFGLLFKATNSSGNWRIDDVRITFYKAKAPAAKTYAITTNNLVNGSILFSTDGDTFEETIPDQQAGADVYFKLVPNAGYEISGTPTVSNVAADDITDFEDGTYGFTMPASAVTVSAIFAAKTKYDITANAPDGGTYTIQVDDQTPITVNEEKTIPAYAGAIITMISAADGTHKPQSTPFVLTVTEGDAPQIHTQGDSRWFEMPNKAVTVTAKYSATYSIAVSDQIENGEVTVSTNRTSQKSKVTVTVTPNTHYHIASVYYIKEGEEAHNEITMTNDVYSFSMVASNVTVYAEFAEDTKYTITFVDNLQGEIVAPKTVYENETFTFPTITDKDPATIGTCQQVHYHFMGWVLSTHEGTIAAGDIKTGTSAAVTAAATYFAVWAKEEL